MEPSSSSPPTHIAIDLPCVGCGYNLRTLSVTGLCPECARAVADSLPPVQLVLDSTKCTNLKRRAAGLAWIPLLTVILIPSGIFLGGLGFSIPGAMLCVIVLVFTPIILLSFSVAFAMEARAVTGTSGKRARRGPLVVVFALLLVTFALTKIIFGVVITAMVLAPIALHFWTAWHARRLAAYGGNKSIEQYARVTLVGFRLLGGVVAAVGITLSILHRVFGAAGGSRMPGGGAMGVLLLSLVGAYVLLMLLHASLMFRVYRWLRRMMPDR